MSVQERQKLQDQLKDITRREEEIKAILVSGAGLGPGPGPGKRKIGEVASSSASGVGGASTTANKLAKTGATSTTATAASGATSGTGTAAGGGGKTASSAMVGKWQNPAADRDTRHVIANHHLWKAL